MTAAVFEDKDWRRPIFGLARNGLVFVILPMLYFAALSLGGPLHWAWVVVLPAWGLGAIVEGCLRWRAIATAEAISRVEVQAEQVTSRVMRVKVSASAFRRIKRVTVALRSEPEPEFHHALSQRVERRVLPGAGRRIVSAVVYLSVPDLASSLTVRLHMAVDGCPVRVYDLPIRDRDFQRPSRISSS